MKKILLFLFLLISAASFAQVRLAGTTGGWTTVDANTYTATFTRQTDLTGNSFTCNDIETGFRVVSGTAANGIETALKMYTVTAIANSTSSTIDLTVDEVGATQGAPSGLVFIYDPDGRMTIPQVPVGSTGATAALQAAIDTYNSRYTYSVTFTNGAPVGAPASNSPEIVQDTSGSNILYRWDGDSWEIIGLEIALGSGAPGGSPATGQRFYIDYTNNFIYWNDNGSWSAMQAVNVPVGDLGGYFAGTEVEAVTQALGLDVSNLQTLSGRPDGSTHNGTFTGSTIPDNETTKQNLQSLETAVETKVSSVKIAPTGMYRGLIAIDSDSLGLDINGMAAPPNIAAGDKFPMHDASSGGNTSVLWSTIVDQMQDSTKILSASYNTFSGLLTLNKADGGTVTVTSKQIDVRASAPTGTPSYPMAVDTVGTDTIYFANNGAWVRFSAGGGGTSAPSGEILVGTGASTTSESAFNYNTTNNEMDVDSIRTNRIEINRDSVGIAKFLIRPNDITSSRGNFGIWQVATRLADRQSLRNETIHFGYNFDGSSATDSKIYASLETHYMPFPGAGYYWMEAHLPEIKLTSGDIVRPASWEGRKDKVVGGDGRWSFRANSYYFHKAPSGLMVDTTIATFGYGENNIYGNFFRLRNTAGTIIGQTQYSAPDILVSYTAGTGGAVYWTTNGTTTFSAGANSMRFQSNLQVDATYMQVNATAAASEVFRVSNGGIFAYQMVRDATSNFNTTSGVNVTHYGKYVLNGVDSTTYQFQLSGGPGGAAGSSSFFHKKRSPESQLTGSPGDVCFATVAGVGGLFIKETGSASNTGWKQVITTGNYATTLDPVYWKLGAQNIGANANIGSTDAFRFGITTNGTARTYYSPDGRVYSNTITDYIMNPSDSAKISGTTIDLAGAVKITGATLATGDISVPDEAFSSAWNGSVEVPTKNAVYDYIARDTQYFSFTPVPMGTNITQTAGFDFGEATFVVPSSLNGYTVDMVSYAILSSTATTGSLTIGLRKLTSTNTSSSSNNMSVTFSGGDVRETSTSTLSIATDQILYAEVHPSIAGDLDGTIQGLTFTVRCVK